MPETAPFGTWKSPITTDMVASASVRLSGIKFDGDDLYWVESRPLDGGRQVIVRQAASGEAVDAVPALYNVRSKVHEYGGGAFTVSRGVIVFSDFRDNRVWKIEPSKEPVPISAGGPYRYADFLIDHDRQLVFCVQEDHGAPGEPPINAVVSLPLNPAANKLTNGEYTVCGSEFFASPRLSPDGRLICWLSWNHPNMPWDGCELWMGNLDKSGMVAEPRKIAGGKEESIFQPEWLSNSSLTFISDRSGWWNLYLRDLYSDDSECLAVREKDFGLPQWVFGMSTYTPISDSLLLCSYCDLGLWKLALLRIDYDNGKHELTDVPSDLTDFKTFEKHGKHQEPNVKRELTDFSTFSSNGKEAAFLAGGSSQPAAIVRFSPDSKKMQTIKSSANVTVSSGYISTAQPICFDTAGGDKADAFYYPPCNPDFAAPDDELPPLLVKSHGGPTGTASSVLNMSIQYWTSRGFAVVDVNYRGSAGFGRKYRNKLVGQWGVVDVQDCEHAAKHLVATGKVDGNRLTITGGSAGGYTTLCALTFGDTFKAGASHFGVSDLETLVADTHKFESRYGDNLVGPYPASKDVYVSRSPIHFTDKLSCPVIFFQGLEDAVVPPQQAETMVKALRKNGLPVAYIEYEGEQHGFRKAENIKRTLEAEFYFYSRVFGFTPADAIEPVPIDNMDTAQVR